MERFKFNTDVHLFMVYDGMNRMFGHPRKSLIYDNLHYVQLNVWLWMIDALWGKVALTLGLDY